MHLGLSKLIKVPGIFIVCSRIDKGDVLAIESKQVIEMKEGNTIAPYTFRRVSTKSREVISQKKKNVKNNVVIWQLLVTVTIYWNWSKLTLKSGQH